MEGKMKQPNEEQKLKVCPVNHWSRCPAMVHSVEQPCRGCQGCWLDKLILQCSKEAAERARGDE